jgi:nitric oxide dioxygenase
MVEATAAAEALGMSLDIDKLEESFDLIAPRGDEVVHGLYSRVFDARPDIRPLFPVDMTRHERLVLAALIMVRSSLRDLDRLLGKLRALGARHVAYGAKAEYYPLFTGALVDSMAAVAGEQWTVEYHRAWTAAADALAAAMMQGAEEGELAAAA